MKIVDGIVFAVYVIALVVLSVLFGFEPALLIVASVVAVAALVSTIVQFKKMKELVEVQ